MPKTWSNQESRTGLLGCRGGGGKGAVLRVFGTLKEGGCARRFRHFGGLKVPKIWSNQGAELGFWAAKRWRGVLRVFGTLEG